MVGRAPGEDQQKGLLPHRPLPHVIDRHGRLRLGVIARPGARLWRVAEEIHAPVVVMVEVRAGPEVEALPRGTWRHPRPPVWPVQVPLADVAGVVSAFSEGVRDAHLLRRERNVIQHQAKRERRSTRKQRAAVRRAHRHRGNPDTAVGRLGREAVEVWREDRLFAGVADGAGAKLVGEDQQNVRAFGSHGVGSITPLLPLIQYKNLALSIEKSCAQLNCVPSLP